MSIVNQADIKADTDNMLGIFCKDRKTVKEMTHS